LYLGWGIGRIGIILDWQYGVGVGFPGAIFSASVSDNGDGAGLSSQGVDAPDPRDAGDAATMRELRVGAMVLGTSSELGCLVLFSVRAKPTNFVLGPLSSGAGF